MLLRLIIILLLLPLAVFAQKSTLFSPESGIHISLKEVVVKKPKSTQIFYTINGEKPTKKSRLLQTNKISISGNTALRFLEINEKGEEKRYSKTYIINRDHDLPVFSIIIDPVLLFDSSKGMYSLGDSTKNEEPYTGANFLKDWEREARIAYIDEENSQVIDQVSGLKMFGGFSLGMPQKSFALHARNEYGNNRFKHEFFEDRQFKEYKSLVLRNAGSDMQGAHLRDAFASTLVKPTGLLVQSYRPVAVYINGEYWGKYNLREKINEHFIEQHYGYDSDSLIIMRHEKRPQVGSTKEYVSFLNTLKSLDLSNNNDLNYVDSKIDIKNYLLYNACEIYTGNADAGGNIRYFKHLSDTSKWRWIFYDVDHSMNIFTKDAHRKNSVKHFTTENIRDWPHPNWSTFLIRKLLENDSIKELYIQQFSDLLNTVFEANNAKSILDSLKKQVDNEARYHQKRWGVSDKLYDFSFSKLYTHVRERPKILFKQLQQRFELDGLINVQIYTSKGGVVQLNNLTLEKEFNGRYFKNIPLHIEAIPDFDYRFVGWKELNGGSKLLDSIPKADITLTPVFEKASYSPFLTQVVINEIDAEQDSAYNSDFIELFNISGKTIDLGGWILSDKKHYSILPKGLKLEPKGYLVITKDSVTFRKSYKNDNFFAGLTFGVNKKGETICLYDSDSLLVDQVSTEQWGLEKEGMNWSRVSGDCENEFYNNWTMEKPTPGRQNLFCGELHKQREKSELIGYWVFVSGIIFASLLFIGVGFKLLRN